MPRASQTSKVASRSANGHHTSGGPPAVALAFVSALAWRSCEPATKKIWDTASLLICRSYSRRRAKHRKQMCHTFIFTAADERRYTGIRCGGLGQLFHTPTCFTFGPQGAGQMIFPPRKNSLVQTLHPLASYNVAQASCLYGTNRPPSRGNVKEDRFRRLLDFGLIFDVCHPIRSECGRDRHRETSNRPARSTETWPCQSFNILSAASGYF